MFKVSRIESNIIWQMKNPETLKSQGKIQSTNTNSKMTQMLDLPDKDIKAEIVTVLWELRVNNFVMNEKLQQQNRTYKEKPNANIFTEIQ